MTSSPQLQIPPIQQLGPQSSPLRSARLQRKLTREEAAKRADISPEQVSWLEEGRLYRFPSAHVAISTVLVYAYALGIDQREALELAGRPRPSATPGSMPRILGAATLAAIFAVVAVALAGPRLAGGDQPTAGAQTLPPPWRISVDVLNGSGDINHTRRIADRIGSLAYHVAGVEGADRFDYRETAVYYEPGGKDIAERLAAQLEVGTKPLPGGNNPRRLIVIVGPATIGS